MKGLRSSNSHGLPNDVVAVVFSEFSLIICSSFCISCCSLSVFGFMVNSPSNALSNLLSLFSVFQRGIQ